MKLTKYFIESLLSGDPSVYGSDYRADDFPFEVTEEELKELRTNYHCDSLDEKADEYWNSHGIEVVENKISDTDLEKAIETRDIVFKFDDKYYSFSYDHSPYVEDGDVIGEEPTEVKPVTKTYTVYVAV
jgi:hypothetical protein